MKFGKILLKKVEIKKKYNFFQKWRFYMGLPTMNSGSSMDLYSEVDHIANFKSENRRPIGHMVSLSIGGEALERDFNFVDPLHPAEKTKLSGILTFTQWNKREGGILVMEGRISNANQGMYQSAVDARDKGAKVKIKFNWYYYDSKKGYYKKFHTDDKEIEGEISTEAPSYVDPDFATEYKQILNHRFSLLIVGSDEKDQNLCVGYSPDLKANLGFGQLVGA